MPPAYPAPSPAGKSPAILDSKFSSLIILTGDDVLLSTADKITSSSQKPSIRFPKYSMASLILSQINSGKISLISEKVVNPFVFGLIVP